MSLWIASWPECEQRRQLGQRMHVGMHGARKLRRLHASAK
jgi:hypothetical protein